MLALLTVSTHFLTQIHRVSDVLLVTALEKFFTAVGEKNMQTVRAAIGIRPPRGQELTLGAP